MKRGYTIIQEELAVEKAPYWPFWILVACILVNCTRGKNARPVLRELRRKAPTPQDLAVLPLDELYEKLWPLGFGRKRALRIHDLALVFYTLERLKVDKIEVKELPGCAQFAEDAWKIFVLGDVYVEPSDKELKAYLDEHWNRVPLSSM